MLKENIKKLNEKEDWDFKDMGQAIGIVMARALKNSGQTKMSSLNANGILTVKSYKELSDVFVENFTGYYSKFLDHDEDADVNVFCGRVILFLEDKINSGEEMSRDVIYNIVAGYNMQ